MQSSCVSCYTASEGTHDSCRKAALAAADTTAASRPLHVPQNHFLAEDRGTAA